MKTSSHFSSKNSALVLGTVLTASTLFAGITLAQGLSIPTDLTNAVITIQRILLSSNGVSTSLSPDANVTIGEASIGLDGSNGSITTRGNNANLTVGGTVTFQNSDYQCGVASGTSGSSECILRVDTAGRVSITDDFTGASNDDNIFKRTPGTATNQKNNIYLALEDGEATVAGKPNTTTQSFLRVGAGMKNDTTEPSKDDTAMVVGGVVESRGGIYIKKTNNDAELSNSASNRTANVTEDYTALDLNTQEGKVNFRSNNRDAFGGNNPTSFLFSADGANTKVGINFDGSANPVSGTPKAELHIKQDGKFIVGSFPGDPSTCGLLGGFWTCTSDDAPTTLIADSAEHKVGIGLTNVADLQKTLNVEGNAAVTDVLTVGHPTAFDPGTDKLAINGNTRANAYYYNSDRRYKSDIVALKSPLENLLKISGYHYYSKLEKKDTLGVIAQEVEAVYPELVQTDSQGYKSVQYGNLVAPIIEAIRELSTKIDNLFTLYVSQQAKIDTLEARLLKLESQLK